VNFTKIIARKIIFPVLLKTGLEKLYRNAADHSILNVMYHGVVQSDSTYFSPRHITASQFEQHLKYYQKEFEIITLKDAFEYKLKPGKLKKKAITISFDDGFQNNLKVALPLLEKYNMQATFFIATLPFQPHSMGVLWPEIIACLNCFYKDSVVETGPYRFEGLIDRKHHLNIHDFLTTTTPQNRDSILRSLLEKYDLMKKFQELPEEIWSLMTAEELVQFSKSKNVSIGSHSHMHYNLGNIDPKKAEADLQTSKKLLENLIGKEVNMLAYPDGSYTQEVKNSADKLGFNYQLAVNYKFGEDQKDPRILNRFGISSTTTFESNMIFLNKAFKTKGY
jgi:peptidoglycan/xylan/chitin deacetylase (PgdA/CDA1 family)